MKGTAEMSDERIETENVRAPSEIRDYDWRAWFPGRDGPVINGWGSTKDEAVADLKSQQSKGPTAAYVRGDRAAFSNALRVMTSLDRHELEQAGVLEVGDHENWSRFRRDPFRWYIGADDASASKLFALVMQRAARS